jgi:hypothetical protein
MEYSLDDLRARLAALDAKVAKAARDLKVAEARLDDARKALGEARRVRAGAEAFINDLANEAEQPARSTSGVTAVVERILREHPEGIELQEIQQLAPGLDAEQVRSATTYLRRRGDAERIGRGMWRIKLRDQSLPPSVANDPTEVRPFPSAPSPLNPEAAAGGG